MEHRVKVAVGNFPPLVSRDGRREVGFEIDLWEAIAKEVGIAYTYEEHQFQEIIPLLAEKKIDVGIAGLTINEKRERILDFSFPVLDSGLLILVNKKNDRLGFFEAARLFAGEAWTMILPALLGVLAFALIFANALWFVERGAKTFSDDYFPGVIEALWLVICSMSTDSFGDYVPHTWAGRAVTTLIIIGGVAIFGLLVAQVSAFIVSKKSIRRISNSKDLMEKRVATVDGSTSIGILRKLGSVVVPVPTFDEAVRRLRNKEVEAVVFDAPVVEHFIQTAEGKDRELEVAGEMFDKQKYGFALLSGSPLREKINVALLRLRESGEYDLLYHRWFGENSMMEV